MTEIEPALSSAQAARFLGVGTNTLAVWRTRGTGPPHTYSGEKPVYYASQLRVWQAECAAVMRHKREQGAAKAAVNGGRRRGRPTGSVGLVDRNREVAKL